MIAVVIAPACVRCLGSGEVKADVWRTCPACGGEGEVAS